MSAFCQSSLYARIFNKKFELFLTLFTEILYVFEHEGVFLIGNSNNHDNCTFTNVHNFYIIEHLQNAGFSNHHIHLTVQFAVLSNEPDK